MFGKTNVKISLGDHNTCTMTISMGYHHNMLLLISKYSNIYFRSWMFMSFLSKNINLTI